MSCRIFNFEPIILKKFNISALTTIDFMRHGEPVGGRKYRGQLDDPLSEKGWQQMWGAVGTFSGWDVVMTSPLQRCADFADALAARLNVEAIRDDRLKEGSFGAWEGKLPAEISVGDPLRLFAFKCDPISHAPEGAEPVAEVHARVGAAWRDLIEKFAGRHILVVAHAGVIRMVLSHALGLPLENVYRIQVGNASLTRIQVERHDDQLLATLIFHDGRL